LQKHLDTVPAIPRTSFEELPETGEEWQMEEYSSAETGLVARTTGYYSEFCVEELSGTQRC
jgi:hypothetical protein